MKKDRETDIAGVNVVNVAPRYQNHSDYNRHMKMKREAGSSYNRRSDNMCRRRLCRLISEFSCDQWQPFEYRNICPLNIILLMINKSVWVFSGRGW